MTCYLVAKCLKMAGALTQNCPPKLHIFSFIVRNVNVFIRNFPHIANSYAVVKVNLR